MKKIAILGCGNLGQAILSGLLDSGIAANHLIATRRNTNQLSHFAQQGVHITADNKAACAAADYLLLALKPHNILDIFQEIQPNIRPKEQVLVSLATGVTIQDFQKALGDKKNIPLVRAMPNTAADVAASLTCLCTHNCSTSQQEELDQLFSSIGKTVFINEELMEAATILGACGIAYVLRFIRGMIQGGIQVGFSAKTATEIVTQTVHGAAKLLIERGEHPEQEIDKVTTPKGCTIVGLNEMEHAGFSSALIKGIVSSYQVIEKKE